jgi:signal transduction histidine kinase
MQKQSIQVLLVEDNLADAGLLRQGLSRLGSEEWQIVSAETLEEAIALYQSYAAQSQSNLPFDLVLLDLGLPDSTGLETLKQFRAAIPDVSVVVLTGLDDEELALQAVVEGAQDYIVKDQITIQRFSQILRFAIERQQLLIQRKQSEERFRQALEREQELNELKSKFVEMVSHEFRNPLTIIRTASELLQKHLEDSLDLKCKKWFDRIQFANAQLIYLIDDVLNLSRIQSSNLKCEPIRLDLATFCLELTEDVSRELDQNYKIEFVSQGTLNNAFIDANLIRSICTNLLSNAIKYTPQGGTIRFDLIRQGEMVQLCIQDPGLGIPEQEQHRLFDSFYRGSNVTKLPGTGLGLSIVKRCVDALQGQIQINSALNQGTTVMINLPYTYHLSSVDVSGSMSH